MLSSMLPRVERKAPVSRLASRRNGVLPISIQSVYSLQVIVPVVQRIEQGFPNPPCFPSHEASGAGLNRQKAPIPA